MRVCLKLAARYRLIASRQMSMLQQVTVIAAQGQADAERFIALGTPKERVVVTGNLKFDLEIPPTSLNKANNYAVY